MMSNLTAIKKNPVFWQMKRAANHTGELYIYGEIAAYQWEDSDTTAQSFKKELDDLGDIKTLNVYINSPGGSVFQGQAIHTILKRHKARVVVHIDGVAASIASVVAMAGDKVSMPANAMMMIHNPWTIAMGNAQELRKQAESLDKIRESIIEAYLSKAGQSLSRDKLTELLDAETWLTAKECYDYGLCNEIGQAQEIAASIDMETLGRYKNVPKELIKSAGVSAADRQRMITEARENVDRVNRVLRSL
ncbi:ATP-dependent Clp protease proteolytic subunit [Paenibacillus sp. J31TS4]|uniref:head maturation protease, ClpP-related n=1 Tax=Paenibacillus sp. J31TS4 TaxID=2807195 RepID=UPI001B0D526A|nr:head maturation protease, ClpP-related [Paenibacillus sp. J31TS4]GIP40777.1 ATP-dependent Clp protease proteolytic subunit [Paenibacillus sp. J31TS4]